MFARVPRGDQDVTAPTSDLAALIAKASLLRGEFTLRSGQTSTYYLDKYLFSTKPAILEELGREFAARLPKGTTLLAGAELGGIPLVTAAAIASGVPCVFIRNARKNYGTSKQLEGVITPGDLVVVLEDVATTGGQVLEAIEILRGEGAEVTMVIATIDRLSGARENVEGAGVRFEALFTVEDLGIDPETE